MKSDSVRGREGRPGRQDCCGALGQKSLSEQIIKVSRGRYKRFYNKANGLEGRNKEFSLSAKRGTRTRPLSSESWGFGKGCTVSAELFDEKGKAKLRSPGGFTETGSCKAGDNWTSRKSPNL